jgi:hypothetical protein
LRFSQDYVDSFHRTASGSGIGLFFVEAYRMFVREVLQAHETDIMTGPRITLSRIPQADN